MQKDNKQIAVTKIASLETLKPDVLGATLMRVRSVKDALILSDDRENYPSIALMNRNYGDKKTTALIKMFLIDLRECVNLKRPLKDAQIDMIAMEIVETYYNLTIADIYVIFKRAKLGEYGEMYESLDVPKIMSWFRDYFNDRCDVAASISESQQFYDKGGNLTSKRVTAILDKLEKRSKQ